MAPTLVDRLAEHRTVGSAPRAELEWLATHGSLRQLQEGDRLSTTGQPVTGLFVLLTGHVVLFANRGAGPRKVIEWRAGDVTGMLPYSRLVNAPGDSIAQGPTEVLALALDQIGPLIRECPSITASLVHTMLDRAKVFTTTDLQNEKMISLGKLSAGLAHELNNPAAAIERSASLLDDRLEDAERATRALGATRLSDPQLAAIDAVRASCLATRSHDVLSPIQRAEREDDIADWLERHGQDAALAGPLGDTAVTLAALDELSGAVDGPPLAAVLRWVAAGCSVRGLASEIQEAAMRITGLVAAVKGFTHMDQGTLAEPVDVKRGLGSTVAVLNSKARAKAVAVTVDVPSDLPRPLGFVGELNQIWANLIDNALDAVADSGGRIEVSASNEHQQIVVRVVDNGPGIPPEIRERLFEPFFTTKPVGKGTGLGLDIVRRLATHNNADIEVDSVPGRTEFRVTLPLVAAQRGVETTPDAAPGSR